MQEHCPRQQNAKRTQSHSKLVPECSAPKWRQDNQPAITMHYGMRIERTHYKMTKWLKCRNITPDNKNSKHRRHTTTQCLSKATHPIGNNTRRAALCKVATVHPHITYWHQHTAQPYTDHTYILHPIQQRSMRMAPSNVYQTVYISIMALVLDVAAYLLKWQGKWKPVRSSTAWKRLVSYQAIMTSMA